MLYNGAAGYQSDSVTGLQLLGHRYYDPSTGRFLSSDPAQAGTNWYAYCDNNPLVRADPNGLSWWKTLLKVLICIPVDTVIEVGGFGPEDPVADGGCIEADEAISTAIDDGGGDTAPTGGDAGGATGDNPGASSGDYPGGNQNTSRGNRGAGSDLPIKGGPPGGSMSNDLGNGKGIIRDYDDLGRANTDYDFGHDYEGQGDPHAHDWDWDGPKPRRLRARPWIAGE